MKFAGAGSILLIVFSLSGCTSVKPDNLGIQQGRLAPCPNSPNCVSSDATDDDHQIAPYRLKAAPQSAWSSLQEVLVSQPRTEIVTRTDDYLHARATSRIFRFVDDMEFHLRPDVIAVRSASRVGYSDLGANRERVERIRERLQTLDIIE
jgi:uncharacterized protein (DUF1499 family)